MRQVEHEPLGRSLRDALEPVEIEQPVAVLEVEEDRRVGDVRPRSLRQLDRRGRDRQSHRQRQPRRPAGQRHRRQPAAALGERTDEIVERARGEVAARPDDSRRSAGVEREQVAGRAARGGEVERVGHGRQGGCRAERAVARAEVDRRRRASPLARIDEHVRAGGVRGLIDLRAVPRLAVGRGEHADRDREHEQQDRAGVAARPAGDLAEAQRSDDAPGPAHQPLDERGDERHQPQREQRARDQEQRRARRPGTGRSRARRGCRPARRGSAGAASSRSARARRGSGRAASAAQGRRRRAGDGHARSRRRARAARAASGRRCRPPRRRRRARRRTP